VRKAAARDRVTQSALNRRSAAARIS